MALEIVVVGGGPTGLMLASELRLAGVRAVVLEQLREPTGLSKALGLSGRVVDALDYRGLLGRFRAGMPLAELARFAHFGGIPLDVSLLGEETAHTLPVQQAEIERVLLERATELGVEIRRGYELVHLRQDDDGVTLGTRGPGGDEELRARFVVGCDGGHSVVRKQAGIAFPGLPPTMLCRLGDVRLPAGLVDQGHLALPGGRRVPVGVGRLAVVPIGSGLHRVVTSEAYPEGFDRKAPMTLDELQASIGRAIGEELPILEVRWLSRFTDASRQAERYRQGNVLLAGDAAHIHLPAGGPGLNAGLQDAINLGWKLAAEIHGWAPPGLLDSYHTERHAEGERLLMHTRAQGALIRPDPRVAELREIFAQLLQDASAVRRVFDLLRTLDTRYEMDGGAADPHPLLGRWAPDLPLFTAEGRTRVAELMHGARGMLLDLEGNAALQEVAAGWDDRVITVAARCAVDPPPAAALLVRPDGYVAWVSASGARGGADPQALGGALARWFGAARPR